MYPLGFKKFYHIDLYRIESEKDVEGLGLLEIIQDSDNIVVIEWPEKIDELLPGDVVNVTISENPDGSRTVEVK